jgi:hypothetical protein
MTNNPPPALWHFTCDHGHLGIGDKGLLLPGRMLANPDTRWPFSAWPSALVWATDLAKPNRDALGLTSHMLRCDRTAHRYRIDPTLLLPWIDVRHDVMRKLGMATVEELEATPGSRPMHWWVGFSPVMADYDPLVTT